MEGATQHLPTAYLGTLGTLEFRLQVVHFSRAVFQHSGRAVFNVFHIKSSMLENWTHHGRRHHGGQYHKIPQGNVGTLIAVLGKQLPMYILQQSEPVPTSAFFFVDKLHPVDITVQFLQHRLHEQKTPTSKTV